MQPLMRIEPKRAARIAVYSCYFGAHEPFNPDAAGQPHAHYDRFVFTDHARLPTSAQVVTLADCGEGPAILSRLPKLCPHLFFQGYDWVIYLDNNARFSRAPIHLLHRIAREHPDQPAGRYFFRHRRRDCAWDEADECLEHGHLTEAQHAAVLEIFRADGFPRHAGLFVNTCLVQRMGDPATDALNEAWYGSLSTLTRRDQIMLPWLLASRACPHRALAIRIKSWVDWPIFGPTERAHFRSAAAAV